MHHNLSRFTRRDGTKVDVNMAEVMFITWSKDTPSWGMIFLKNGHTLEVIADIEPPF